MPTDLDSTFLILLFTLYYFVERILRAVVARYNPTFLAALQNARKDPVFFGISMGLIISLASARSCSKAAWASWSSPSSGFLESDAKFCLSARAVLWVSELNRLDLYPVYVMHHAGAISSLLAFLYFRWPGTPYLVLLSTLVSEVPGDILWMLSAYIDSLESPSPALSRFKLRFNLFNVAQYAIIRGGGIMLSIWLLLCRPEFGIRHHPIWVQIIAAVLILLYALFCGVYVVRQSISNRASWLSQANNTPSTHSIRRSIHIRIPTSPAIIIVPYGFYMGLGFAALVLTSFSIAAQSPAETGALKIALRVTLFGAVACARLFSVIMEDGLANLIAHPLRTIFRPGFWLHGGLFGAALGAMIAQQLGYVPHLSLFAASLAVGLPLYEMFSRIGCHTYGCCYGAPATVPSCHLLWRLFPFAPVTYDHPTDYAVTRVEPSLLGRPLIPIQLISAALFFLLFACVSLPLTVYTTPQLSGAATLAFHAAVRLATETCRADYRGARGAVSSTGQMALVQAAGAGAWLAYVLYVGAATPGELNFRNLWEQERLETCASVALVGIVVYGIHIGEIGTWVPNSNTEKSTS